jgi:hypothetical protein
MLAWSWRYAEQFKMVVVNYSPNQAQGRLRLPMSLEGIERVVFYDELTGTKYIRDPDEVSSQGLYVDLAPWHAYILRMDTA